jgi:hypothetical protein
LTVGIASCDSEFRTFIRWLSARDAITIDELFMDRSPGSDFFVSCIDLIAFLARSFVFIKTGCRL